MTRRDIEITIDEVVLDAPFGARAAAFREALSAHLARIFAERGAPDAAPGVARTAGDLHLARARFDVSPDLGADAIAARVAEGLYEALGGARGGQR